MTNKFRNNKLEQNRGLLLQVSIIISLIIVTAAFNYTSKNKNSLPDNFVEIKLEIDSATRNNKIQKPLPAIFNHTDKPAEFIGGEKALSDYFKNNLHYPEKAEKQKIQGRVYVKFTVTQYGTIKNIKIVRKINPLLDAEALRLIKNMPVWKPAEIKNNPVKSEQILPVIFINN